MNVTLHSEENKESKVSWNYYLNVKSNCNFFQWLTLIYHHKHTFLNNLETPRNTSHSLSWDSFPIINRW